MEIALFMYKWALLQSSIGYGNLLRIIEKGEVLTACLGDDNFGDGFDSSNDWS